jgi:hypothetical protein
MLHRPFRSRLPLSIYYAACMLVREIRSDCIKGCSSFQTHMNACYPCGSLLFFQAPPHRPLQPAQRTPNCILPCDYTLSRGFQAYFDFMATELQIFESWGYVLESPEKLFDARMYLVPWLDRLAQPHLEVSVDVNPGYDMYCDFSQSTE